MEGNESFGNGFLDLSKGAHGSEYLLDGGSPGGVVGGLLPGLPAPPDCCGGVAPGGVLLPGPAWIPLLGVVLLLNHWTLVTLLLGMDFLLDWNGLPLRTLCLLLDHLVDRLLLTPWASYAMVSILLDNWLRWKWHCHEGSALVEVEVGVEVELSDEMELFLEIYQILGAST